MRVVLFFLLVLVSGLSRGDAAIAIVIDDMGNNLSLGQQALALPGSVTYAFLPRTPHATILSQQAHQLRKESMVHLPMQAFEARSLGPGALDAGMALEELAEVVRQDIESVPYAAGVNNHMGSLLTSLRMPMEQLMELLSQYGDLYFLDSRTHDQTVAEQTARAQGVPTTRRNLFLDNVRDEVYIEQQFRFLLNYARHNGTAVAIGHPYAETLAVLQRELPGLEAKGIELIPVSALIAQQDQLKPSIVRLGQND